MSVTAGFYRNWTDTAPSLDPRGLSAPWETGVTDNLLVTPADYNPYCITAPRDPRLPGGGGYQVCGLYDLVPGKFGQIDNVVTHPSNFGNRSRVSNYFTVSVDSRLGSGLVLGGSIDTGRTVHDNCFVVDSPQQLLNCHVVTPFKAQTLVKVHGSVPLPASFVVSAILQNLSGIPYDANYPVSNAEIAPSLGRNLAACGTRPVCTATATVPLIPPQTMFDPRRTLLDLRFSRLFEVGPRIRLRANVDVYNALNSSAVLNANHTYGPQWRVPVASVVASGFVEGRLLQLGGQVTW
jgi:hypothetical protein